MINDELRYEIIRLLEADPAMSQRDLARALGVSLGRTNYCLRALIHKGLVKVSNFRNSQNRRAYLYRLTPSGIEEKSRLAMRYLQVKLEEYENLREEIERLRSEAGAESPRQT